MKTSLKNLLISSALLGFVTGALGQGSVWLDNSEVTNRVSVDTSKNPYTGIYGIEVWRVANSDVSLSGMLDMTAATNGLAAYSLLAATGFQLDTTFTDQAMTQGVLYPHTLFMGVQPAGSTITLALAAWNSAAPSWSAAVAAGAKAGVIAFVQHTADFTLVPPPGAENLNWNIPQDLVMMSIVPEPGTVGLFFVAASVLLTVHWRNKLFRGGSRLVGNCVSPGATDQEPGTGPGTE